MKNQLTTIFLAIVIISSSIILFMINYYIPKQQFELKNTPDHIESILGSCACQERVKANPDTLERCPQYLVTWQNSTHYIDNNLCRYVTLEEHYGVDYNKFTFNPINGIVIAILGLSILFVILKKAKQNYGINK